MTRQSDERKKSAAQQEPAGVTAQPTRATIEGFARFLDAFPERDEPRDVAAARAAWERAIRRGAPETIIAGAEAYARAREGQPARYTMSTKRWLTESRWQDLPPVRQPPAAALVWIDAGTPEWRAWTIYRRKTPPLDRRGGWRFPSRWPPTIQAAE
jgi:hypothetical protein